MFSSSEYIGVVNSVGNIVMTAHEHYGGPGTQYFVIVNDVPSDVNTTSRDLLCDVSCTLK